MAYDYDLFVIGGGSGGVRAARMSSQYGAKVALAEEYRAGGTCVIRGCVPKKLMVYASHFKEHFEDAKGYGWSLSNPTFSWQDLITAKDKEINRLEGIYESILEKNNVELFKSRAEIRGPNTIYLKNEDREVTAKTILIATGGRPNLDPQTPGCEFAITSDDVFDLQEQPKSILIAGAGYIALEFACIFNALGTDTTVIYRGSNVLKGFDDDIRNHLRDSMEAKGIKFIFNDVFAKLEKTESGSIRAHTREGKDLEYDHVFFAIGRSPYTQKLGLEFANVQLKATGEIQVDEYSKTSCDSIYAVGDVTSRVSLTPVAIVEGSAFASTVFNDNPISPDHDLIPTAVFTQPEIGTIGLTEDEAKDQYKNLDVYISTFRPMKNTLAKRDEKMMMKLIVDADTDTVLGLHIIGNDAGEMIQLAGVAIKMGAKKADFDATMAVHPTAAEELVTLKEPTRTIRA